MIQVRPKPRTSLAPRAAGAFVNCWIDFREKDGAEHLAKYYLAQEGWDYEETKEARWVDETSYENSSQGQKRFVEAQIHSPSFVVNEWPVDAEADG